MERNRKLEEEKKKREEEAKEQKRQAEINKARDQVSQVKTAIETERQRLAMIKRRWLMKYVTEKTRTLEEVQWFVKEQEYAISDEIKKGNIEFNYVPPPDVTAEEIL